MKKETRPDVQSECSLPFTDLREYDEIDTDIHPKVIACLLSSISIERLAFAQKPQQPLGNTRKMPNNDQKLLCSSIQDFLAISLGSRRL